MTPSISFLNPTPMANSGGTTEAATSAAGVDKNMFLELLVAQLKNQDPLNPADGTQFVTQLAQFQQLEQTLNTGEDVAAIRADLDKLAAAAAPAKS